MYDKASVLRVETVINNPREFRILRVVTDAQGRRERRWCPMRKGVSDLYRNFQVGMGANQRYLQVLAAAPLNGEGGRTRQPTDWGYVHGRSCSTGRHDSIGAALGQLRLEERAGFVTS